MSDVKVHYTEIHVSIKNNIKVDLLLKIVYSNICCFSEFSLKKKYNFLSHIRISARVLDLNNDWFYQVCPDLIWSQIWDLWDLFNLLQCYAFFIFLLTLEACIKGALPEDLD